MIWSVKSFTSFDTFIYDTIAAPAVTELALKKIEEVASCLQSGAKVLDVGCGGGQLAIEFAKLRADLIINGLDLSPQQIKRARKRATVAGKRIKFFQGSALKMPFKSGTYDLVYSIGSIKHWPDYMAGLRECLRLVKTGGLLVIAEVDKNCPKDVAAAFVSNFQLPGFIRPLALMLFRIFVSGRSLTLNDADKLFAALPVKKYDAETYSEGLFWIVVVPK